MTQAIRSAATVGAIAKRLQQPIHRIAYVIRTRELIPEQRAGKMRIFSEADVTFIASELRRIDADRKGGRSDV